MCATRQLPKLYLNFKVIGQRSRSHGFFCFLFFTLHDYAAATRGQYGIEQGLVILLTFF